MVGIKDIHQQKLHALNVFPNHPLFIRSIQNTSIFCPQTVMHCTVQYRHSVQQIYLRHKLYEQAIKIFSIKTIFASSKQNKQIIEMKKRNQQQSRIQQHSKTICTKNEEKHFQLYSREWMKKKTNYDWLKHFNSTNLLETKRQENSEMCAQISE